MKEFRQSILELITQTSTNLPADVRAKMAEVKNLEQGNENGTKAINIIYENVNLACRECAAICQDTGMLTFDIHCPVGIDQMQIKEDVRWAVAEATHLGRLRPNSIDSISGKNSGNNLSATTPIFNFKQWDKDYIEIALILKGGGCENVSEQISLPAYLGDFGMAMRDLDGVKKSILYSIWKAQGCGCPTGFIGVAIGSDRAGGYTLAKEQLFRALDDLNPDIDLAKLEKEIVEEANNLGVGTMGFGGKATLLGCKISVANRLPASFYVTIAYNCWAFRRLAVKINTQSGAIEDWHQLSKNIDFNVEQTNDIKVIRLTTPLKEADVRKLKVGDIVSISGKIFTGRDSVHQYLMHNDAPTDLADGIIYHCGPVVTKSEIGEWIVQAAGPTTSSREEPFQADIIEKFGLRAIIGKGGMGNNTLSALQNCGAVYLHAIGGAARFYAKSLPRVHNVYLLDEFGIPEAMWKIEAKDFITIVTMDSHGNSLHADVLEKSKQNLEKLFL